MNYHEIFDRYPTYVIVEGLNDYYHRAKTTDDDGNWFKLESYPKSYINPTTIYNCWHGYLASIVVYEAIDFLRKERGFNFIVNVKPDHRKVYVRAKKTEYEAKPEKTFNDIFNTLTDKQKKIVYFMVGEAINNKDAEIKKLNETIESLKDDIQDEQYRTLCWTKRCDELQNKLDEVNGILKK